MRVDGGEKRGHFGGEVVPPPGAFLMSLSLLSGWCSSERPGAVKGAPMLGAAKRNLDSEDRSGTMGQEGKASERPVKDGSAKMAPSRAALNRQEAIVIRRYVCVPPGWL